MQFTKKGDLCPSFLNVKVDFFFQHKERLILSNGKQTQLNEKQKRKLKTTGLNTRTTKNWSPFFIFSCPKNCQNVELYSCLNSILSKQPLAWKGSLVFMLQRMFWKLGLECKQVAATTQHSWHQMATFWPNFGHARLQ